MIRIATAALAALIAMGATPSFAASNTDAPMVVAQNFEMRMGGDRDRDRDGMRDRDGFRERRMMRERRMRGFEDRGPGCRTIVVRRNTPNGTVTRRTRSCG